MAVYSKRLLSGCANGQPIIVTGVLPSTANTIHTAVTDTAVGQVDEIYIYAYNTATADRELTLRWGATATGSAQNLRHVKYTVPWQDGLHLIVPGLPMNDANTVKAFATIADQVGIVGYVNRVT